ncbi:glycosyltransferase family 4 protein, partial [bacterium]|nr:glycosyltransferase family 4 protein [candidate division CSSED10-310 bacterium]
IGWIGSPSTQRHLALVGPALSRLHRRNAEAFRLRCVGAAMPAAGWPAAEYLPWRLAAEREHLYSFDIGIMPLYDTPWDRFKCAFKAILCMAAGIPVVASPVGTINGIIEDGVNGFLARDDREWVEKLTVLLADRTFYEKMSRLGRDTVAERFDIRRLVALWMDVLSTAVAHG